MYNDRSCHNLGTLKDLTASSVKDRFHKDDPNRPDVLQAKVPPRTHTVVIDQDIRKIQADLAYLALLRHI